MTDDSALPAHAQLLVALTDRLVQQRVEPETGTPLGYEQVPTTDAGKLNVQVPAVIGYASFLAGGPVQSTDETGPRSRSAMATRQFPVAT